MVDRTHFTVVAGPPCAGKSTVARLLSERLGAPHLEMDAFRRRLLPVSDQRVEHRDLAYSAMHFTAELMAPRCATIVLDATYTAAVWRRDLARVVERVGGALCVIEGHVDPAVASERFVERREHPAIDLTPGRVAALATEYRYFAGAHGVVLGSHRIEDLLAAIRCAHPLDRSGVASWCRHGARRARASGPIARRPAAESWQRA